MYRPVKMIERPLNRYLLVASLVLLGMLLVPGERPTRVSRGSQKKTGARSCP
jgi:hypothetical protein